MQHGLSHHLSFPYIYHSPKNIAMSSWRENQIPLILGYTGEELFPLMNLVLPAWLLLAMFPKWKYTQGLVLIPPLFHAIIYAWSAVAIMMNNDTPVDFSQLQSIVQAFRDPNTVFLGWTHYICFDLVVGRAISRDAIERGITMPIYYVVVVPCLFLTLMLGPCGFVLYYTFAFFFLNTSGGSKKKEK